MLSGREFHADGPACEKALSMFYIFHVLLMRNNEWMDGWIACQMAMVAKIILTVLCTAGYVASQSTTDDSASPLDLVLQLRLHVTNLELQLQRTAEVLDRQQQQLGRLNELETIITNRVCGKLGDTMTRLFRVGKKPDCFF